MLEDTFVGDIRLFAGDKAPNGWLLCDGSVLRVSEYDALASLLQNTYGGDGVDTFAVPDLRSRIPMGLSAAFPIATQAGSETVALNVAQLPAHGHTPACSLATVPDQQDASGGFWSAAATSSRRYADANPDTTIAMNAGSIGEDGGDLPHENRMPVIAISYIISFGGMYPQFP
ncbi:MAG: hypothetical protein BGO21_14610 [Dyadobacter sp. 50-39]|uniref:phage tail protein n=1 Tax=Dyadobacter sp. 50-39 TaxID=1895756 RepID=UPI00095A08A9|nr:tail fiber protein [Dyadobacter sp. 50-39]OJV18042.1 MAG: hypothetical protein BGO21_14610 [Dyadobacter sp. 50-39]